MNMPEQRMKEKIKIEKQKDKTKIKIQRKLNMRGFSIDSSSIRDKFLSQISIRVYIVLYRVVLYL